MSEDQVILGLKWFLVFIFSTTVHEAAHAWVALRLGDDTAHRGGQVTLDPTPHIRRAPFGMVVVPLLSYALNGWMIGWASAPYDPNWAARYPKRAATMSLAGPVSNLLIVLLAAIAIHIGMAVHYFQPPSQTNFSHIVDTYDTRNDMQFFVGSFLSIAFSLNLLLCTFNLLPLPPLDGSGVLMYFVKEESAAKYMEALRHPSLAMLGIFIAWKVYGAMFPAIHLFAINLLYPGHHYEPLT